jgi:hypothetical protein
LMLVDIMGTNIQVLALSNPSYDLQSVLPFDVLQLLAKS